MALAASLSALVAVAFFTFVVTALGHRLFRLCSFELVSPAEHLLCSTGLGVICAEICLFLSQMSGNLRAGVMVVIFLLAAGEFAAVFRRLSQVVRPVLNGSRLEKTLASLTGLILLVEGLAAIAPLAGSDALHYHFAAPQLILTSGFHPKNRRVPGI